MFDWNDLKYLLAFARKGSTLAAARALGVSQSTVQRRLAELENCLGKPLIERDLTGYRLTELGEQLQPYVQQIEEAIAVFERRLAACEDQLAGTIRLTCPTTVAERLIRTDLLEVFHERYPGLRIELLMSDKFLDLGKGEADIAIRAGESAEAALIGRTIAKTAWALYGSRSYLERHGRPGRPDELERHLLIALEGAIAHYPAGRWLRSIAPRAAIAARSDNWPGVISAVKSGAGLVPLPVFLGDRESELLRVIDNIPELTTTYYLLAHRDLHRTRKVRAFFDFVRQELKGFRAMLSGQTQR